MTLRDDIAELRRAIPNLKRLAMPDVDNFTLERLLDFTDKAIAALRSGLEARLGCVCDPCAEARAVIALLDKEIE